MSPQSGYESTYDNTQITNTVATVKDQEVSFLSSKIMKQRPVLSFQTTSNLQSSAQSTGFVRSAGSTAYGWDIEKEGPSDKIRKMAYYSTSKNLYLTSKDTKRRLKQNLLISTITPFLSD